MTDYFSESAKGEREIERETKTYVFFMLVRVVNTTTRGPRPKTQLLGGPDYSSVRHHGHSEAIVIGF